MPLSGQLTCTYLGPTFQPVRQLVVVGGSNQYQVQEQLAVTAEGLHSTSHGTQGTVVRAKHALDYGLAPDKIVHDGPARTTLWTYGMESRNIFSYVVQTRPGPRLEFFIVTSCIVHSVVMTFGTLIVIYVLHTMFHITVQVITIAVLRIREVGPTSRPTWHPTSRPTHPSPLRYRPNHLVLAHCEDSNCA
jgi:hypothetical protein